MKANDAILVALLVVLVIIVAYQGRGWMKGTGGCEGFGGPGGPGCSAQTADPHQRYPGSAHNPYTVLNQKLSAIRGYRNDGYNQPPFYRHPHGLDRYHLARANVKPEQISEAERAEWYEMADTDRAGHFNTELMQESFTDAQQYNCVTPAIDYGSYVTDLVTDPRTRDNHRRWVEEMKPWSGTAMKVDTLDLEPYIDFIGLRRPQPVVQYNPLQLTEVTTEDLAVNPKFNFRG